MLPPIIARLSSCACKFQQGKHHLYKIYDNVSQITPVMATFSMICQHFFSFKYFRSSSTTAAIRSTTKGANKPSSSGGDSYFNFTGYPFPLGPITRRKTIRREVRERKNSQRKFVLFLTVFSSILNRLNATVSGYSSNLNR
jgi:hypothetical protein